MIYIPWFGGTPPCNVICLCHFDEFPLVNEAAYPFFNDPSLYYSLTTGEFSSALAIIGFDSGLTPFVIAGLDKRFNHDITIEFRVRRPGSAIAFFEYTTSGNVTDNVMQFGFGYFSGTSFEGLVVDNASGTPETIAASVGDGDYHAVAIVCDNGVVLLFVDGILVGSCALPSHSGGRIASFQFWLQNNGSPGEEIDIDELRVTINEARYTGDYTPATGPWLTAVCDSGTEEPPPSGPASTLLLKFDSGLLVDQNSTRTNTLTSNGTPTAITTDPKWGTHCAEFDSTSNENIDVASPSDFKAASGEATIDFWFKPSTAGSNTNQGSLMRNALFTTATSVPIQQYPIDNTHLWWWWNTANGGTFGLANSGQTVTGITSGVWHHFRACFYTDNTMNFYVDGTRVGTNLIAGSAAFDAVSIGNQVAAGLALDGAAGSFAWQGSIDSVRILTGTALEPSTATTMTVPTADFPTA